MSTDKKIEASIHEHLAALGVMPRYAGVIGQIVGVVRDALAAGNKILTCGNGGSAAEAMHLAEEMVGRFSRDRAPLAALCLASDPSALTCIANDFGYERVFARQIQGLGRPGDVLVCLSTSGKSPNILNALEAARALRMKTVGLLGRPGSPAEALCDIAFMPDVPASAHVQELHLMLIHLVLEQLEVGVDG
ncbi:MAG TPA: SIS domain-containing protein [Phycisphaerae bacterium]|nr:SIS domain-containing protein [Phycisphaerae bacterium]